MLVLSRRTNETIHIGDEIYITVLGVEGDKVKIGISAPRDVTILRGEIFDAVQSQEKIKALLVEGPEPDTFKDLRDLLKSEIEDEKVPILDPSAEGMPVQKE
jgi:carbon storage regulator